LVTPSTFKLSGNPARNDDDNYYHHVKPYCLHPDRSC
jgi:hypothetical protein